MALKWLTLADPRDISTDGYQRQWSSYWDSADKLTWPISGCADSCSVADLAPWGQRTAQWTDGWLVLASEQKKRTVPCQGCPRFINSLCVWYVPFLSLQLLAQKAHPASPFTDQQANPIRHKGLLQQASTNHLVIWDIMTYQSADEGRGINRAFHHVWNMYVMCKWCKNTLRSYSFIPIALESETTLNKKNIQLS